jgi:tetratricopeptide (TPR) repeat protein
MTRTEAAAMPAWLADTRWSAALVAAVLLVYARMWWAGFIWDDDGYVINNQCLWAWDGLWAIWFEPSRTPQYYPLTHTSFWVEYQLWRLWAPYYHVVNVVLHAANAVLLWAVLRQLAVPGAWLGATLFALHPVEVETVAWITERKNTLSAFFGLAFLLAWLRYRFGSRVVPTGVTATGPTPFPVLWLAIAVALFVASLLCKTVTITLIGVVLVISWWKTGRVSGRDVVGAAPLLCLGLPLALATVVLEKQHVGASGAEWALGAADRIVLAGRVIVFYFTKLLWPQPLLFFYPRWEVSAAAAWQWLFPAAVAAVLAALWAGRHRLGRGPLAATLMFIGMLFPALGFFDVFPFQYSFVADHFQYHASAAALAGLAAAATLAAGRLSDARLRTTVLAVWVAVLACMTAAQTRMYVGLEPLYQHVLAHDPGSFIAANNLGSFYSQQNRLANAQTWLETAVRNARFDRQKSLALWNLCDVALRVYDNKLLLDRAREAYALVPTIASRSMLALALVRNGDVDAADKMLQVTDEEQAESRVDSGSVLDANQLARAEVAVARKDMANAPRFLDAVLRDTENDWVRLQAGIGFARLGLGNRAAKVFGGLRDHPLYGGAAFSNLGVIALEQGNQQVAEACFLAAARRDRMLLEPHIWLARLYGRQKKFAEAEIALVEALRRAPDDQELAASLKSVRAERATAAGKP